MVKRRQINKKNLDQYGSLGSIVQSLSQDAEEFKAPVHKLERIKVIFPALVDTPYVKSYVKVTSNNQRGSTKSLASTKVDFQTQKRSPAVVTPKYEGLASFAKTTAIQNDFFAEIKEWSDNRNTCDLQTISSIIQEQKESYVPQKSSIKLRKMNYSQNSVNNDQLPEQFRQAKRLPTLRNQAQFKTEDYHSTRNHCATNQQQIITTFKSPIQSFRKMVEDKAQKQQSSILSHYGMNKSRAVQNLDESQYKIDDMNNRFEKSTMNALFESRKLMNQLYDVEEIEMNSESDASENQALDQEIGLENAIIGRLHKTRKSLEKFDTNDKISRRARQNTMAIEFHKIQKHEEKDERTKFSNKINMQKLKKDEDVMHLDTVGFAIENTLPTPKIVVKLVEIVGQEDLDQNEDVKEQIEIKEINDENNVQKFKPQNQEVVVHPGFGETVITSQIQFLIDTWKQKNSVKNIDRENVIELKQIKQHEQTIKKLKFTEIGRNMNNESFVNNFQQEPMLIYHRIIKEAREICLPLISKVIDCKLVLQGYTLDSGHFEALATSIKETQQPVITDVYLDNCGVDDHELSLLLDGLTQMKKFEKFVYINNVFQDESLEAIQPLLKRQQPFNLQELRLVNLQTSSEIIESLLDYMIEENVQLRTLGLVQLHIGQIGIAQVARFVQESEFLDDLDLSWNDLIPLHFTPLLEVISENRTLKSLNLSWNMMIDKADQNNPVSFEAKSAADEYAQRRREAIKSGTDQIVSSKDAARNHPQLVIYSFNQFIRYNLKLQSINLSNCGLNSQVLVGLVPAIRHAKSLLCLHLTSNPGINDQVQQYYSERLNIAPKYQDRVFDMKYEDMKKFNKKRLSKMPEEERKVYQHKLKFDKQWKTEEVFKYMNNKHLKPLTKKQNVQIRSEGRDLTINRILGHIIDLPGMGRWQLEVRNEQDSCWRCDNWMYTLIFWHPTIGDFNQINNQSIDKNCKKDVIQKIRNANKDNDLNEEFPLFFSNVSDWMPRPFFPILDLANQFEKQEINLNEIDAIAIEMAKEQFKFKDFSLLGKDKLFKVKAFMREKTEEMVLVKKKEMIKTATEIIYRNLRYKKPKLIDLEYVLKGDFENVWVLPIFLPSGKNEWMIRSHANQEISDHVHRYGRETVQLLDYQIPEDAEFKYYYNRSIIGIREESVPKFTKELKSNKRENKFDLKRSVFKDWKDEDDKAFQHDVGYWKLNRITNDSRERQKTRAVIWDNFSALKEIFLQVIAHYKSPPDIKKREFNIFCAQAGILDKNLTSGIVDTYFKATNFEEFDMESNADDALCRFEFMEIMIRLAKGKFIDHGKEKSLSKAVQMLLENHVLPMTDLLLPWSRFRRDEMYDNEVNSLMEINLVSLRLLYERLRKFKHWNRNKNLIEFFVTPDHPSIDQMVTWLNNVIPGVTSVEIVSAWYLSKMICSKETDHSEYEYTFMRWPEFIEFVPRLAFFKYFDDITLTKTPTKMEGTADQMKLVDKIKSVLDCLLPLIGEVRTDPPAMVVVSDSDDDY